LAIEAIDQELDSGDELNTGELFFKITSGKSKGKQHVSGKKDGEVKKS